MQNEISVIEVKDLKKSFKAVEVLKGVTFMVERDSIFALLVASLWIYRTKTIAASN